MVSISEYDQRVGINAVPAPGTRCRSIDERRGTSESRAVRAPHYTELHNHGSKELARIIAAQQGWRLTRCGELVDEHLVPIARTIDQAAGVMEGLGWFAGDDDGEVWVDWERAPSGPAAKADALRSTLGYADRGPLG